MLSAPSVSHAPIWKYNSNTEIGLRSTSITDAIGNSGGFKLTGGTASGDDLTLESTSNATKGTIICLSDIDLQSATPSLLFTDTTSGHDDWQINVEADDMTITPDATPGEGNLILDCLVNLYPNFGDETTMTLNVLTFDPTFSMGDQRVHRTFFETPTVTCDNVIWVWSTLVTTIDATFTVNPVIAAFNLLADSHKASTTVSGGVLPSVASFIAIGLITATNVTATCPIIETFVSNETISSTGASGDITVTDFIGFNSGCILDTDASGDATITTRTALHMTDAVGSGAGTEDMGTQIGVDLEDLTFATTNISFRSQGSGVEMRHAGDVMIGANAAPASTLEVQSSTAAQLVTLDQNATTSPFFDFQGTTGANTTSTISTHGTSGATTDHIQIELNGTKAWIAVSTNNPSA